MSLQELAPGRELDIKIATIMGWTEIEWVQQGHVWEKQPQGVRPGERPSSFTGYRPKFLIPKYSTEIASAWELIPLFKKNGYNLEVGNGYIRALQAHPAEPNAVSVLCESDAHGVCLLAVKLWGE